jgi:hypothetical protein
MSDESRRDAPDDGPPDALDDRPAALEAEQAELARLLVRSAKLDAPSAAAKERILARGLDVARQRPRAHVRRSFAVAGVVLAAAAGVALWVHRAGQKPAEVAAERVTTVASTRSNPSAPASASAVPAPAPCVELVIAKGDAPLIEDFEQDDSWVLPADGRKGSWITYDDGSGKQVPPSRSALFPSRIPGGRGTSKRGLHVSGSRFTQWGVTFGTELADAACYDASAYGGIEFWAKGPGEIRVGLQMIDVQDVKYGGQCQTDCYDTHRKIVTLAPTFRKYVVRWEDLRQLYAARVPVAFDPRRVRFLEFGIAPESTPFDVWLDDVSFVPR